MSERKPESKKDAKQTLQLNELCKTCENYKNDCKGIETILGAHIISCGNKIKYKKIKNKTN